jgi:O-antigen/teichoic acid export membrane protein
LLKTSLFAFGLKVVSAILTVLFSVLIGRLLGIADFGFFSIVFTIVSIFVIFFQFGMPQVITRYISRKKTTTGTFNTSILFSAVLLSSMLMFVVLPIFELVSSCFFSAFLLSDEGLSIVALIFSMVVAGLVQASLNGLNKAVLGILVFEVCANFIKVTVSCYFYFANVDVEAVDVLNLILASTILSLVAGVFVNQVENNKLLARTNRIVNRALLKQGSMLLVLSSSWLVMLYSDILVLSWLSSTEDVGGYAVAQRLSTIVVILLSAVNSVISPKLSNFYRAGEMGAFASLVKSSTFILLFIGLGIMLLGLLLSKSVMGIWGEEFSAYFMTLNILLIGQFVNVATGSVGVSLIMIGKSRAVSKAAAVSAILNIALNLLLVSIYGVNGAAIATAFSLSILNLLYLYFLYKETGIISVDICWLINKMRKKYA